MKFQDADVLERTTQFFALHFRPFAEENYRNGPQDREPAICELSLKCCGYGYFPNLKDRMLANFQAYLQDALARCPKIALLKIVLNGFAVREGDFQRICTAIGQAAEKRILETLWLHTTNLQECRLEDLGHVCQLMRQFGSKRHAVELSVQLADWQFQKSYPPERSFFGMLQGIADQRSKLHIRKFRLQISSWYTAEGEAFQLLKDIMDFQDLKSRFDFWGVEAREGAEGRRAAEGLLEEFLRNLEELYLPHELPNRRDSPVEFRRMREQREQFLATLQANELKMKAIRKFPKEYILKLRVERLHTHMAETIAQLVEAMPELQELQVDLRNWSKMLALENLKKKLDTTVFRREGETAIKTFYVM